MYKVLLVDDEILVREAIGKKIEWNKLGFELAGDCENGKAAIEFLEQTAVDVVLTDICMPYVDGMELSRWLYENHPETSIIIFSGYSDFEYAKQAIQYKVSEYILKPVTARELSEVLTRMKEKLDKERKNEQKINQLTRVFHTYTKNESLIISRALSNLVRGTQEVKQSLRELSELGIRFEGTAYRIAVIDIDVYSDLCVPDESLKKESALMSFVVENIASEIVESRHAGVAYHDSDNRVCLVLCTNRPREFRQEAVDIFKEIQKYVHEAMKLSISVGIGCYVESPDEFWKSYNTAADMLKYRYTKGMGQIFDGEEHFTAGNPMELEADFKDITLSVKRGNRKLMEEALDHLERWITSGYITKSKASAYLQEAIRAVYIAGNEMEESFALPDDIISAVTGARNFEKAMELTREYARQQFAISQESGQSSAERQAALAMEYLKENYANQGLSLNDVCEYLNISVSRFSSIFKEITGKTFTEALTSIRMEKAKQLLRQTSLKNYEIAEKVGFSDPHYFSVSFKKMTGMTPKEFAREN